jgi:hypothetical protein
MSNHGHGQIAPDFPQDIQSAIRRVSDAVANEFGVIRRPRTFAPLCTPAAAIILGRIADDLAAIAVDLDPDYMLTADGTAWAREKLETAITDLRFIQSRAGDV